MSQPEFARGQAALAVAMSYVGFVLVGVSTGANGVLIPAQIDDYGVTKTVMGTAFIAFGAGFLAAGSCAGPMNRRLGDRTSVVSGTLISATAALASATRPAFAVLVGLQVLAGFGSGVVESALNAFLSDRPNTPTLLNRLHGFFGVGALIGPPLAARMLGHTRWTSVLAVLGVLGLLIAAATAMTFPRSDRSGAASLPSAPGGRRTGPGLSAALRQPGVVLAAVLLSVYVGLEISVGNWGYTFLLEQHHFGRQLAGFALGTFWFGLMAGRFLVTPVAEAIGRTPVQLMFSCLVGTLVTCLIGWWGPGAVVTVVALGVLGMFLGPIFPTTIALTPRLAPASYLAAAIGVMNAVSVLGGGGGPWLAGTLSQGVGEWTLMPYAAVLGVVLLVVWHMLARHLRIVDEATMSTGPATGPVLPAV